MKTQHYKSEEVPVSQENILSDRYFETLYCDDYDYVCKVSKKIAQYLLKSSFLYCATVSKSLTPFIVPIIYSYDMNRCTISFLISKTSKIERNLRRNPFISLSTDILNKKLPTLNTGLMVQAFAQFSYSNAEMKDLLFNMRKRYTEFDIPQLVDQYLVKTGEKISKTNILVNAKILKIVYWQGYLFLKDFTLVCPARKFINKQSPNFTPDLSV